MGKTIGLKRLLDEHTYKPPEPVLRLTRENVIEEVTKFLTNGENRNRSGSAANEKTSKKLTGL